MKKTSLVQDKPILDYGMSCTQMGDLLMGCGDPISKLSPHSKEQLRRGLERYMTSPEASELITLDLGTCYLVLKGADEAGYLYDILIRKG
ncbi:hypothetical protein AALA61_15750 [Oscillospiraceae bacterium 42-9]